MLLNNIGFFYKVSLSDKYLTKWIQHYTLVNMQLLNTTVSARDVQRSYSEIADAVMKSNKPVLVMNRNQAQMALLNLKQLEEYQYLKSFAFLESLRVKNKHVDFNTAFTDITDEVEAVRATHHEE